tara:strand:+ start:1186 stop:1827 length:642 start_codon:yes stop_codon:yes gene_type:complete
MNRQPIVIFDGSGCAQADGYSEENTVLTINSFAERQTANSGYSHFEGTNEELLDIVVSNWHNCKPGYRQGVVLISVPPENFYSGVCKLETGDALEAAYLPRREGEAPRKTLAKVGGEKLSARRVEVVVYASSVLAETSDNELPEDEDTWEIVSINAAPLTGDMPIHPQTLMHNHFGSSGGTKTNLTNDEFVDMLEYSFLYWKDKAMVKGTEGE